MRKLNKIKNWIKINKNDIQAVAMTGVMIVAYVGVVAGVIAGVKRASIKKHADSVQWFDLKGNPTKLTELETKNFLDSLLNA